MVAYTYNLREDHQFGASLIYRASYYLNIIIHTKIIRYHEPILKRLYLMAPLETLTFNKHFQRVAKYIYKKNQHTSISSLEQVLF